MKVKMLQDEFKKKQDEEKAKEKAKKEAQDKARNEAIEKAKKEAEAKREAEEKAKKDAEELKLKQIESFEAQKQAQAAKEAENMTMNEEPTPEKVLLEQQRVNQQFQQQHRDSKPSFNSQMEDKKMEIQGAEQVEDKVAIGVKRQRPDSEPVQITAVEEPGSKRLKIDSQPNEQEATLV